jgi:hypothetical protein
MAITTNNSIRVNPPRDNRILNFFCAILKTICPNRSLL